MKITRKRFLIFCLVVMILALTPMTKPIFQKLYYEDSSYYFYASNINDELDADFIKCGNAYIIKCNIVDADIIKSKISGIQGETLRIKNYTTQTYQEIINKYSDYVVENEYIDNMTIMLCYDKSLPNYVTVEGRKVNTQIAISNTEINIGYPLILNGY